MADGAVQNATFGGALSSTQWSTSPAQSHPSIEPLRLTSDQTVQTTLTRQSPPDNDSMSDLVDESNIEGESGEPEEDEEMPQDTWTVSGEDTSEASKDELAEIESRGEHSALDHDYWETNAFFDVRDPMISPDKSGRINWTVENFSGIQGMPDVEPVAKSPSVEIGGYDWCIKLYPRGNETSYLSVYVECVTMQSPDFAGYEDFEQLPLPHLASRAKPKKRCSVAAQICVVMYNPAEPRVNEYRADAHQFRKEFSDFGWSRFSQHPHGRLSVRHHGQRQAILRDDKLAFSAYIRIVHDPTGCIWMRGTDSFKDSIETTSLRPFPLTNPVLPTFLALLHLGRFRKFLLEMEAESHAACWFQRVAYAMMTRETQNQCNVSRNCKTSKDIVAHLQAYLRQMRLETDPNFMMKLFGTLAPEDGALIGWNRLKIQNVCSLQAALSNVSVPIDTPGLLIIELQRHEYDRNQRTWIKLTKQVISEDLVHIDSNAYGLFAFVMHCGDLTLKKFETYVRPNGPGSLWYEYTEGRVTAITEWQADAKRNGLKHPLNEETESGTPEIDEELSHLLIYVRLDLVGDTFPVAQKEHWEIPAWIQEDTLSTPRPEILDRLTGGQRAVRQSFSFLAPGCASPLAWLTNGQDNTTSDLDSTGSHMWTDAPLLEKLEGEPPLSDAVTIDFLGRDYYHGQLRNSRYHGRGHLICMNGDEYEGDFINGKRTGQGKMTYALTGDVYEGTWLNDQHEGHGTLTEASTGNIYEGGWRKGKKHGQFTLTGTVTDDDKTRCQICYENEMHIAFSPCGHVICCKICADIVNTCPVCREEITSRLQLYGVRLETD